MPGAAPNFGRRRPVVAVALASVALCTGGLGLGDEPVHQIDTRRALARPAGQVQLGRCTSGCLDLPA
jgi:hypothetical protein